MKFLTNVVVAGLSSVLALGLLSSPLSQAQEKTLFEELADRCPENSTLTQSLRFVRYYSQSPIENMESKSFMFACYGKGILMYKWYFKDQNGVYEQTRISFFLTAEGDFKLRKPDKSLQKYGVSYPQINADEMQQIAEYLLSQLKKVETNKKLDCTYPWRVKIQYPSRGVVDTIYYCGKN
jgi:hypothetical protein